LRRIAALLLITIIMASVIVGQVQAVTVTLVSRGKWWQFWKWAVIIVITPEQLLDLLTFDIKSKIPVTDAFGDIEMVTDTWGYTTDGDTYLELTAPSPIETVGEYYVCDFVSVYDDFRQFNWEAYDVDGSLVESGDVLFRPNGDGGIVVPVDKLGLLTPYIGLVSIVLVATVATAVYTKHVKGRKEKQ